jgi:hypothetical protein
MHAEREHHRLGDRAINRLFRRLEGSLGQEDKYLCRVPLDSLLQKSWAYEKEWIAQAHVVHQRLQDSLR